MPRFRTPLLTVLVTLAIFAGCSKDDPVAPSTDPVDPAEVNKFVNSLPSWEIPSDAEEPPVDLGDEEDLEENQYYRCGVVEYDLKKNESVWKRAVNQPRSVQRLPNGNTLVVEATPNANRLVEFTPDGEEVWSYKPDEMQVFRAYRR